jgi:hypothetical protein
MENMNFLENLATRLGQNASVKNVYGEPVIAHDKTIIPVLLNQSVFHKNNIKIGFI